MKNFILTLSVFLINLALYAQDAEFHLNKTYSIDPDGIIYLQSSDAKVSITGTNRNDVHVQIHRVVEIDGFTWGSSEFDVEVEESNGNLKIIEDNEGSFTIVGSVKEKYEIKIEAPKNVSLDIEGDDDNYYIKGIDGSVVMNVDDGDIDLVNCNGENFDFQIDDGDLSVDQAQGKLHLRADDADIVIKNASFTSIYADLDDGDLFIQTSLSDNGNYEFQSDDSEIEFAVSSGGGEFRINHDDGNLISTNTFETLEKGDDNTLLKLPMGNAKVYFNTDDSTIRLSTL